MPRAREEKLAFADRLRATPTGCELEARCFFANRYNTYPRFLEQHLLCGWIVDFYFPSHRTVLEIDGSIHDREDHLLPDKTRHDSLVNAGYTVFHVKNSDFYRFGAEQALAEVCSHLRTKPNRKKKHKSKHPYYPRPYSTRTAKQMLRAAQEAAKLPLPFGPSAAGYFRPSGDLHSMVCRRCGMNFNGDKDSEFCSYLCHSMQPR